MEPEAQTIEQRPRWIVVRSTSLPGDLQVKLKELEEAGYEVCFVYPLTTPGMEMYREIVARFKD